MTTVTEQDTKPTQESTKKERQQAAEAAGRGGRRV